MDPQNNVSLLKRIVMCELVEFLITMSSGRSLGSNLETKLEKGGPEVAPSS